MTTATRRKGRVRGNSDARDAVLRAATQAANDGERTAKMASLGDVEKLAEALTDQYLHCRDFGHQWRMANAKREGNIRTRTMFCPSCKYQKYQTLDSHGLVIEEKPDYPEGYLIKGLGRIVGDVKGALRLASVDRLIEKNSAKKKAQSG